MSGNGQWRNSRPGKTGVGLERLLAPESGDNFFGGVVDAILEVGRQRTALLDALRLALQSGDKENALNLAHQLVGLHEEGRPACPRKH